MATFDQIKEVRLTIQDPPGFIDFVEVATQTDLPSPSASQTAYKTTDTQGYWWYNDDSAMYEGLKLRVSDARIEGWIDQFGVDGAVLKAIQAIIAGLPAEMMIVKNTDGVESTEFLTLLDLQKFYQNWLKDLTPQNSVVSTGKYFKTKRPCIAGGNL